MNTVIKLLGLQELEIEIATLEKVMADALEKLGESPALRRTKANLSSAENNYKQLSSCQKELEWQSEELDTKLKTVNEKLYSGRVTNPKELTSLQQEAGLLSKKAKKLDEETLMIMDKTELAGQELSRALEMLKKEEELWRVEQKHLNEEIAITKQKLATLRDKRSNVVDEITPQALQVYELVKAKKGTAVARVSQSACEGCRIGLSTAQLQRARGESLERCANCGRILFCG